MKKLLVSTLSAISLVFLLGCATTSTYQPEPIKDRTQIESEIKVHKSVSEFDGVTTLKTDYASFYDDKGYWQEFEISARIKSNVKDVIFDLKFHSKGTGSPYANITGLKFRIDGKLYSYTTRSTTNHNGGYSYNRVLIERPTVDKMLQAENLVIRFETIQHYYDQKFSNEWYAMNDYSDKPLAKLHIKKLLAR